MYVVTPPARPTLPRTLLLFTTMAVSGGTLACTPALVESRQGFVTKPATAEAVDLAWFAVADVVATNLRDMAFLNFAARHLNVIIQFGPTPDGTPMVANDKAIIVPATDCIADSHVVPIFVAMASNLLNRNSMDKVPAVRAKLRPLCPTP